MGTDQEHGPGDGSTTAGARQSVGGDAEEPTADVFPGVTLGASGALGWDTPEPPPVDAPVNPHVQPRPPEPDAGANVVPLRAAPPPAPPPAPPDNIRVDDVGWFGAMRSSLQGGLVKLSIYRTAGGPGGTGWVETLHLEPGEVEPEDILRTLRDNWGPGSYRLRPTGPDGKFLPGGTTVRIPGPNGARLGSSPGPGAYWQGPPWHDGQHAQAPPPNPYPVTYNPATQELVPQLLQRIDNLADRVNSKEHPGLGADLKAVREMVEVFKPAAAPMGESDGLRQVANAFDIIARVKEMFGGGDDGAKGDDSAMMAMMGMGGMPGGGGMSMPKNGEEAMWSLLGLAMKKAGNDDSKPQVAMTPYGPMQMVQTPQGWQAMPMQQGMGMPGQGMPMQGMPMQGMPMQGNPQMPPGMQMVQTPQGWQMMPVQAQPAPPRAQPAGQPAGQPVDPAAGTLDPDDDGLLDPVSADEVCERIQELGPDAGVQFIAEVMGKLDPATLAHLAQMQANADKGGG